MSIHADGSVFQEREHVGSCVPLQSGQQSQAFSAECQLCLGRFAVGSSRCLLSKRAFTGFCDRYSRVRDPQSGSTARESKGCYVVRSHCEEHFLCAVFAVLSTGEYLQLWENYVRAHVHAHRSVLGSPGGFMLNTWHCCMWRQRKELRSWRGKERSFTVLLVLQRTTRKLPDP